MSATEPEFEPTDYEGLRPAETTIHNAELRKLRKAANEAQELKARLAEMERREMFAMAGVPLDDPAAQYFVKGYDGDLSPEAIRTAATAARIPLPGAAPSSGLSAEEIRGHESSQQAAAGGTPTGVGPDFTAQLAEMGKKHFAPADDVGRQAHIAEIAALAKKAGAGFQLT